MSDSENLCRTCYRKCCLPGFKIALEATQPQKLYQILAEYPFIDRIGWTIILVGGNEAVVGEYKCTRFNETTGECDNYSTIPRPFFCLETGIIPTKLLDCPLLVRKQLINT